MRNSKFVKIFKVVFLLLAIIFFVKWLMMTPKDAHSQRIPVVVIDGGSTGTRAHLYEFIKSRGGQYIPVTDMVFKLKVPISSLIGKNEVHIENILIKPLIIAVQLGLENHIDRSIPLILRMTSGIRTIDMEKANHLIFNLKRILLKYHFQLNENSVSIITGEEEGLWSWVNVNLALNRLSPAASFKKQSVATTDMGGGSLQFSAELKEIDPELSTHTLKVKYHDDTMYLYSISWEDFGMNSMREKIFARSYKKGVMNQCYPPETTYMLKNNQRMIAYKNKSGKQSSFGCQSFILPILNLEKKCLSKTCSINGSDFPFGFDREQPFYAFGMIYDTISALDPSNTNTNKVYKLEEVWELARSQCDLAPSKDNPEKCSEIMYVYTLLRDAYGIGGGVEINLISRVNGFEVCWGLGAALSALGILSYTKLLETQGLSLPFE